MSITNSNEGALFVNASTADTVVVSQYLKDLFPLLKNDSVDTAVNLYAGLGTPIEQVTTIMAECKWIIFLRRTYISIHISHLCMPYVLSARGVRRARFQSKPSSGVFEELIPPPPQGEFAIPPGGHGNDVQYYFTS